MGRHTRSAFQWLWTQFLVFVRQVLPPSTFPQPLIRVFRSQKPSEAGTPQDFTFSQPCLSPVRQHLRVHLHISGLTDRAVQLSPCTRPPPPQPDLHYHPSHSRLCLGVFPLHYVSPVQWGLSCCGRLATPLNTGKTPAHSCSAVLSPPCCHRTSASPLPQFIFSAQPGSQISGCWNVLWRNKHLSHFFSRRWII